MSADIDECANSPDICGHIGQVCINTPGSYRCECVDGFYADGGYCHGEYRFCCMPASKFSVTYEFASRVRKDSESMCRFDIVIMGRQGLQL